MSSIEAKLCTKDDEVVVSRDMISALPNDLLIQILLLVSTKDAVATMVLSKRWRFLWTVMPKLEYKYTDDDGCKSVWKFLEKSLELHKAPFLETLCIQLGQRFPDGEDVRKWVASAVDRLVRKLDLELLWAAELTRLPKSLYTSKTLVELNLSNKILVDVPPSAFLPSIKILRLFFVVYKDENSLVRLLLGCSVLARSRVFLGITDWKRDPLPMWNIKRYDKPHIFVRCRAHDKFIRCISLVTNLCLLLNDPKVLDFSGNTFSRLQRFILYAFGHFWLDLIPLILNKSPKLQIPLSLPIQTSLIKTATYGVDENRFCRNSTQILEYPSESYGSGTHHTSYLSRSRCVGALLIGDLVTMYAYYLPIVMMLQEDFTTPIAKLKQAAEAMTVEMHTDLHGKVLKAVIAYKMKLSFTPIVQLNPVSEIWKTAIS
ncbi:unnamed protein product, partial [Thlaspi arvense]